MDDIKCDGMRCGCGKCHNGKYDPLAYAAICPSHPSGEHLWTVYPYTGGCSYGCLNCKASVTLGSIGHYWEGKAFWPQPNDITLRD